MPSSRQAIFRRSQGAVALARARLRETGGARAARAGAWSVTLTFAAIAVGLRLTDGANAALSGVVASAAPWVAWLAGVPLSLAAADDARTADRRDGVLALAAARGFGPSGLGSARALAAMIEIARAIAVPLVALALLTAALAGRAGAALDRIGHGAGAALFAIVAGVTLGGVGAACGRVGGARGRWLLVAVVIGPWMLADLAGRGAWSIPGALGAVLDFTVRARSGGA
jgi:hypothetical protein